MTKFKVAFEGLLFALKDRSILIQVVLGSGALVLAWILCFTFMEWIAVLLCIGLVITAEMFNTCIEKLCDMVEPNFSIKIKTIKDMASGAVLLASFISLVVGCILIMQHLGG